MLLIILLCTFTFVSGQVSHQHKMLNWCLDSYFHKLEPGPAPELYEQCTPWRNRSCCTYNTTYKLHNHFKFDFNHCASKSKMSDRCKRHFVQDFCFYECSPNIGPWVVKVNMKRRKERYFQVPLCKSDCDAWFDACQDDFTCIDNWFHFMWNETGNYCPGQTECATFKEIYQNAIHFCETVWDYSWQVVNDSEPCMRLWFDGSDGNPNDKVALLKMNELLQMNNSNRQTVSALTVLFAVLLFAVR